MVWLIQQSVPRITIPTFDGSPLSSIPFITKFHDIVYEQDYLTDEQRISHLMEHLTGEAKMFVKGFAHDQSQYVTALKRLKFLFRQNSKIAQACLSKVIRGKQIPSDNINSLAEYHQRMSRYVEAIELCIRSI